RHLEPLGQRRRGHGTRAGAQNLDDVEQPIRPAHRSMVGRVEPKAKPSPRCTNTRVGFAALNPPYVLHGGLSASRMSAAMERRRDTSSSISRQMLFASWASMQ